MWIFVGFFFHPYVPFTFSFFKRKLRYKQTSLEISQLGRGSPSWLSAVFGLEGNCWLPVMKASEVVWAHLLGACPHMADPVVWQRPLLEKLQLCKRLLR